MNSPQVFTQPGWLDEANGKRYAKDCPTCGGDGGTADGSGTCDECKGSGQMPVDNCPAWVAGLILADNHRRVFDADQDWNYDFEGDDKEE